MTFPPILWSSWGIRISLCMLPCTATLFSCAFTVVTASPAKSWASGLLINYFKFKEVGNQIPTLLLYTTYSAEGKTTLHSAA